MAPAAEPSEPEPMEEGEDTGDSEAADEEEDGQEKFEGHMEDQQDVGGDAEVKPCVLGEGAAEREAVDKEEDGEADGEEGGQEEREGEMEDQKDVGSDLEDEDPDENTWEDGDDEERDEEEEDEDDAINWEDGGDEGRDEEEEDEDDEINWEDGGDEERGEEEGSSEEEAEETSTQREGGLVIEIQVPKVGASGQTQAQAEALEKEKKTSSKSKKRKHPETIKYERWMFRSKHRAGLVLMVARAQFLNKAAADAVLQASVVSLLPAQLLKRCDGEASKASLSLLIDFMHETFEVVPDVDITDDEGGGGSGADRLAKVLAQRAGGEHEVTQLFLALCRGLGLKARYVTCIDLPTVRQEKMRQRERDAMKASKTLFAPSSWGSDGVSNGGLGGGRGSSSSSSARAGKSASAVIDLCSGDDDDGSDCEIVTVGGGKESQQEENGKERNNGAAPSKKRKSNEKTKDNDSNEDSGEEEDESRRGKRKKAKKAAKGKSGSEEEKEKGDKSKAKGKGKAKAAPQEVKKKAPKNPRKRGERLEEGRCRGGAWIEVFVSESCSASGGASSSSSSSAGGSSSGKGGSSSISSSSSSSSISSSSKGGSAPVGRWMHVDCIRKRLDEPELVEKVRRKIKIGPVQGKVVYAVAVDAQGRATDVTFRYSTGKLRSLRMCDMGVKYPDPRNNKDWFFRFVEKWSLGVDCKTGTRNEKSWAPEKKKKKKEEKKNVVCMDSSDEEEGNEGSDRGGKAALDTSEMQLREAEAQERQAMVGQEDGRGAAARAWTGKGKLPMPTTFKELKNHSEYLAYRDFKKDDAVSPGTRPAGLVRGEKVYFVKDVCTVLSKTKWKQRGRTVKKGEEDKAIPITFKGKAKAAAGDGNDNDDGGNGYKAYGEWQTEPWAPPPIGPDCIIPQNEHGSIEMWEGSEAFLPKGATWHRGHLAGLGKLAAKMKISCAAVVTGFTKRAGRSVPVRNGFVVPTAKSAELMAAWRVLEKKRQAELAAKYKKAAEQRWAKLVVALLNAVRVQEEYGH